MHPVVDRDLYRVDGVISGDFVPEGVPPQQNGFSCSNPMKLSPAAVKKRAKLVARKIAAGNQQLIRKYVKA